ncbi:hypothetical protein ACFU8T_04725 [Sphingobacterium spiritivorum]|uniref:DUF2490 domain-containing protein n=1 Tax=Sphingobacterium spiritivorum ATCC 33861 TaxID=525373 RepID=D7VQJ3_SPHSI|nr:hypothetical protein [Sphingobacterium spiritivorum]EFK56044.1 hypothetical protein HMPREF0766_13247 [Sphingobacterium spiritivorum ATCC 33861]QQT35828.1 hypothetical protein I6J01_21680 [Sphingobacterium spiritivorum]WQD32552.1 hypothetical protein U0038_13625 [Sphingobacterium spiritivorum]SUJ11030.1 Uncharacterised protein [Sphingobacterium spiritivorum]
MKAAKRITLFLILCCADFTLFAQHPEYSPEIILGNRAFSYIHQVSYRFSPKWKLDNLTLFDTEYGDKKNDIFFIRNSLAYSLHKNISFSTAVGLKNPGIFTSVSAQYQLRHRNFSLSYAAGITYQKGITLEQSFNALYTPVITPVIHGYFKIQAVANINTREYQRGFQQLRTGLQINGNIYGLAFNLDQFNNSHKTLENTGIFLKHNF